MPISNIKSEGMLNMTEKEDISEILRTWNKLECFKFAIWCAKKAAHVANNNEIYDAINIIDIDNNTIQCAINGVTKTMKSPLYNSSDNANIAVAISALSALGSYSNNSAEYAVIAANHASKAISLKDNFANSGSQSLFWEYIGETFMSEYLLNSTGG